MYLRYLDVRDLHLLNSDSNIILRNILSRSYSIFEVLQDEETVWSSPSHDNSF